MRQSHLCFPTLNTRFYTDTMFATAKSTRGHKCAQVFTNGSGYDLFYPMKKESDASEALNEFIWSISVPKELISDGARAETQGKFGKVIKEYWIRQRITEPHSPCFGITVVSGCLLSEDLLLMTYHRWRVGFRVSWLKALRRISPNLHSSIGTSMSGSMIPQSHTQIC